jgi:hypothetical protein
MVKEIEPTENTKDGRRLTASAKLHPVAGDRFFVLDDLPADGNEFLPVVAETGASAAIASDPTRAMNSPSDLALLQTQDTLTALHKLAPSYRQLMPQRPASSRQRNLSVPDSLTSRRQVLQGAVEWEPTMFNMAMWCFVWCVVYGAAMLWHAPVLSQVLGF